MRNALAVALALGLSTTIVAPADAGPPVPGPGGRRCSLVSMTDPLAYDDFQTGGVFGGPLIDAPNGSLICTIQVDGAARHADPDELSVGGTLPGYIVTYETPPYRTVYLCSKFVVAGGGGTLYWHPLDDKGTIEPGDDDPGHWTTDASAPCDLAITFQTDSPAFEDPVDTVIDLARTAEGTAESTMCVALRTASNELGLNDPSDPVYINPSNGDLTVLGVHQYCDLTFTDGLKHSAVVLAAS